MSSIPSDRAPKSGHVVDRFLFAMCPTWPNCADSDPEGAFYASPEVFRMLRWHAQRFGWTTDRIFNRDVFMDESLPRGEVHFVARYNDTV